MLPQRKRTPQSPHTQLGRADRWFPHPTTLPTLARQKKLEKRKPKDACLLERKKKNDIEKRRTCAYWKEKKETGKKNKGSHSIGKKEANWKEKRRARAYSKAKRKLKKERRAQLFWKEKKESWKEKTKDKLGRTPPRGPNCAHACQWPNPKPSTLNSNCAHARGPSRRP
jgi:hypothetical protein